MSKSFSVVTTIITAFFISSSIFLTGCANSKLSPVKPPDGTVPAEVTVENSNPSPSQVTAENEKTAKEPDPQEEPDIKPAGSDIKVKALYLTGWTVSSTTKLNHYIELANNTELNSYVVDIKDDDGYVGYESQVPAVRDVGGWMEKYDVDKVLKAFHDNNIHVIGRIVCFKDPVLSSQKPELAIKDKRGGLFKSRNTDGKMITWLNPYEKGSWSYLTDIAKEAVEKGFDEIQFDYIRFANDGAKQNMDFSAYTEAKDKAINDFLDYARKELPGLVLSADVFGIICESPGDTEGIGQNLESIGKNIDYISPMAYPSHYAYGQIVNNVAFPKPDLDPYNVVYNTLVKAKNRIAAVEGYKAGVRPYIQDFTASWLKKGYYQTYGPEQVRQQIKAVYDAGYDQWILWDALNTYDESALLKE
jgi:hypothetical protein